MRFARHPSVPPSRLLRFALLACLGAVLPAAPAAASNVSVEPSSLEITGDANDDAITLSTDGTTFTIDDTGTGGVTTADLDCTQVNAQRVTCPANLGDGPIRSFFASLNNGVDSFTNQNFEALSGFISSFNATGSKTIAGGPGSQFIQGGSDDDTIDGGDGDDFLSGGETFSGAADGDDLLIGGPGADRAEYAGLAPVSITLDGLANDGRSGEADNVQVEDVATGNGADTLVGDAATNVLTGGGGNDLVLGQGGDDELYGDFGAGSLISRGGAVPTGSDTLDGGPGRDLLDCGPGFDLALREPLDTVRTNCDRIGAEVVGDSVKARGKRKNKLRIRVLCPQAELKACNGKLKLTADGKRVGKGSFSVPNGKTKRAKATLSKRGRNALRRARGKLLVTVEARTTEPGGVAIDSETLFVHR